MLPTLALLAALATSDSLPRPAAEVVAREPLFAVHRQPTIPLVALRLAVLADDPPGYAGTGHLVQHLMEPWLRQQVERVGGRLRLERTADAVVYTVSGPARELPYLVSVLRATLQPHVPTDAALLRASRDLAEERLAEWETPERHTRSALRLRLFPNDVSAAGTERSASRFTPEIVARAWAEMYRPEEVSVLAVGDVTLSQLRAAFGQLPAAARVDEREAAASDTVTLRPAAPAEATQGWLGVGYLTTELDPAAVSITARLLRDALRARAPGATVTGEHWWTHHGQALVLVLGAPASQLAGARRALNTVAAALDTELSDHRVREAAKALRREMLFYARTPDRMADVLGQFADRDGEANAAQDFYASLEGVGVDQVNTVLRHLVGHTPARVEIAPQRLNPRR